MSLAESMDAAAEEALAGLFPEEVPASEVVVEKPKEATEPDSEVSSEDSEVVEQPSEEPAEEVVEDATPALPDGYVAVPVVTDKLATDFVLRDAEGEVEVPDLIVEYPANGKIRKDRFDKVVKLAQFGVYNEEREQKIKDVEQNAQQVYAEREQLSKLLEEREAQLERLLTDDEFLLQARDEYERQNSPEARAQRAEQEAQTLRVERQYAPILQQNEQFNEAEIIPALNTIVQALPSVTVEELEERLQYVAIANAEAAPTGQRYIPPSRFDAIRKYILEDLAVWAQMQHARRTEANRPSPLIATARAEADKARIEAQKAKRLVGQATKPIGSVNGKVQPKKAKTPANVEEAQAFAEREVLAAMGL